MFSFVKSPVKIGIVGLGKIAVDQHLPAIRASRQFKLVAGCAPAGWLKDMKCYLSVGEMLAAHPDIQAVAICTPPQVRHKIAQAVIATGRHVFLEKPPAATLGEAEALVAQARRDRVSLLAGWHSRFAPAVEKTKAWVASRTIRSVHIVWKEDVRHWHPGQKWIFEAGGMGVFDPGINSLSILTHILPETVIVKAADLHVPGNCAAPIRVEMDMATNGGVAIRADYDFLQTGTQTWSIFIESTQGERLVLSLGGAAPEVDGKKIALEAEAEYASLYAYFETLIRKGKSDADLAPQRIVADAMLLGRRIEAPDYTE